MNLHDILDLSNHGADTFVGKGPQYPWGGLYGGQIVAQALKAAALTIDPAFSVHSLRAYFIRRGDHDEPVRYEVDRIRNGRTFCTRRVVARQAIGAILNLEASFQADEVTETIQTVDFPGGTPAPESLKPDSWTPVFDRRSIDVSALDRNGRAGAGRAAAWMRVAMRAVCPVCPMICPPMRSSELIRWANCPRKSDGSRCFRPASIMRFGSTDPWPSTSGTCTISPVCITALGEV